MDHINVTEAITKITLQQQALKENSPAYTVGEHLKEIIGNNPVWCEIVAQDLDVEEMSIADCEKKIKAWADEHKSGSMSFVPPKVAEGIIKEFYGLSDDMAAPEPAPKGGKVMINLEDFI